MHVENNSVSLKCARTKFNKGILKRLSAHKAHADGRLTLLLRKY